jgi:hypothetical protein
MIHTNTTKTELGLFCKPDPSFLGMTKLFSKENSNLPGVISFRSLDLKTDLPVIHKWVQQDYTLEYWQMNGHFSQLFGIYQCMELNPYSHSFIGLLDDQVICQFDVYSVFADELRDHIPHEQNDCGFHLLMAPNGNPIPGLTVSIIKSFLEYYFSFPEAKRMYAEPDVNNEKSIALLERCGFKRIKTVQMSYKMAHVYCLDRPQSEISYPVGEGDE